MKRSVNIELSSIADSPSQAERLEQTRTAGRPLFDKRKNRFDGMPNGGGASSEGRRRGTNTINHRNQTRSPEPGDARGANTKRRNKGGKGQRAGGPEFRAPRDHCTHGFLEAENPFLEGFLEDEARLLRSQRRPF